MYVVFLRANNYEIIPSFAPSFSALLLTLTQSKCAPHPPLVLSTATAQALPRPRLSAASSNPRVVPQEKQNALSVMVMNAAASLALWCRRHLLAGLGLIDWVDKWIAMGVRARSGWWGHDYDPYTHIVVQSKELFQYTMIFQDQRYMQTSSYPPGYLIRAYWFLS